MPIDDYPTPNEFGDLLRKSPDDATALMTELIGEVADPKLRGFAQAMLAMILTSKELTKIVHFCEAEDGAEIQQRLAAVSLNLDGELARILSHWMNITGFTNEYGDYMDTAGE